MWSLVNEAEGGDIDSVGFVRYAAEIGAEGVELLDVFWQDEKREVPAVKEALRLSGLTLSAYSIGNDLVQPDERERSRQTASILRGVDLASTLGTNKVRVFSGSEKPGVAVNDGLQWIITGLREGATYAEAHGVTLVLENHGLFAGRAEQVRHIIEAVDSPSLRANLDTGNFLLVNESPASATRDLAPLAAYIHLKDFREALGPEEQEHAYTASDGRHYVGTVIGGGDVDLPAVLRALHNAGYDGWLSIEYEGTGDARQELAESVRVTQTLTQEIEA